MNKKPLTLAPADRRRLEVLIAGRTEWRTTMQGLRRLLEQIVVLFPRIETLDEALWALREVAGDDGCSEQRVDAALEWLAKHQGTPEETYKWVRCRRCTKVVRLPAETCPACNEPVERL